MVLGERTNKSLVRFGEAKATVQAVFEIGEDLAGVLEEQGIDCEEGQLVVTRDVTAEGKSVCRMNGTIVSLTQLRETAPALVNIHGQHDNQSLLNPKKHMDFVDGFGKTEAELAAYRAEYAKRHELAAALDKLTADENERLRRIDILSYQIKEIEEAELEEGEEEHLRELRSLAVNAEKIKAGTKGAYEALYGSERQSVYDGLSAAISLLEGLSSCVADADRLCEELRNSLYTIEDAAHEIDKIGDSVDFDNRRLDEIEERLDVISRLKRKYGGSVEEVLAFCKSARRELEDITDADEKSALLRDEIEESEKRLKELGSVLSQKRRAAAAELEMRIKEALSDLDMGKADFAVKVENADGFLPNGADTAEFMISTNAGEPLKSLSWVASGGELSRVMLALKSVLADADGVDTMVFDEIDTGVSGAAAQKIAKKLAYLARTKQVICISHLPQIAAMADNHFLIEKSVKGEKTETSLKELDSDGRVREIARIIDGDLTDTSISHACEMLERAEEYKRTFQTL